MPANEIGITIPDSEIQAFKELSQVDTDFLKKLINELGKKSPSIDPDSYIDAVVAGSDLSDAKVRPILNLVCRLAFVQRRMELNASDFIVTLTNDLSRRSLKEWTKEDRKGWSERTQLVQHLLSPESTIALGAKAADLLLENSNIFLKARVITDVRPVFDDAGNKIQCVIPLHTLVLRFLESGDSDEIHISMDINDINSLKDHLDRAIAKESIIRAELERHEVKMMLLSKDIEGEI